VPLSGLECAACGRAVTDLSGDVVIDRPEAPDAAPARQKVVCHACHADPSVAARFQTMWGLAWLRSHYVAVMRQLMIPGGPGLSGEAVEDFAGIGSFLLPKQEAAE
jgi:hypothetical protein